MKMAFSGHRPEKLPWGSSEEDPRCAALKLRIRQAVADAAEQGARSFLCGMARGCDFYFAEAVLQYRKAHGGVELEAYLPCPSQPNRWDEADRTRYAELLEQCDRVYLVEPEFSKGCMLRRNQAMVDRADVLLTVWDGSKGGTQAAIRYAQRRGVRIQSLWL